MQGGGGSIFALSPSFSSYSSSKFAEVAAKVTEEFHDQREELGLEEEEWKQPEKTEQAEPSEQQPEQQELEEEQIQISSVDSTREKEKNIDQENQENDDEEEDEDEEFEFAILSRDDSNTSPISADEIFANGQIKPIYPVFNRDLLFAGCEDDFTKLKNGSTIRLPLRKLMIEERDRDGASSSSSESDELEALPDGTYCVWTPKPTQASPERCQKSNSTGSSKRWRFRDLLHRSNSDGKDTFVFLTRSNSVLKGKKKEKKPENVEKSEVLKERRDSGEGKDAGKVKSKGISGEGSASPHEAHYVRNRARLESDRRRSYLPYRQDLVGLFANVNGLNRTLRPF